MRSKQQVMEWCFMVDNEVDFLDSKVRVLERRNKWLTVGLIAIIILNILNLLITLK